MTIDKNTQDKIVQGDKELTEKFGAEAFDDFDCRPENSYPEADRDDVIPEHIKLALGVRKMVKSNNKSGSDD